MPIDSEMGVRAPRIRKPIYAGVGSRSIKASESDAWQLKKVEGGHTFVTARLTSDPEGGIEAANKKPAVGATGERLGVSGHGDDTNVQKRL